MFERLDRDALLGPVQGDHVEDVAFGREAEVVCRIFRVLPAFAEGAAFLLLGRALAEDQPRPRPVDGLPVDLQPGADPQEQLLLLIGDRPIRPGPDVEQQVAVFADPVHQVVHQGVDRFVIRSLDVAP